jgi:hypothetical protein
LYAPLEQLNGSGTDSRSDLFSLAATLYHLLNGYPPIPVWKRITEQQYGTDPLQPIHELKPSVTERLSRVLVHALAIEADNRPESALQMKEMLQDDTVRIPEVYPETRVHHTAAPTGVAHPAQRLTVSVNPDERTRMLEHVRTMWIDGVLNQSLDKAVWLELGLTSEPGAVEHPWEIIVQRPAQQAQLLPPGTAVLDVFKELLRSLLILGEPGSGKTTMLLELTQELLDLAENDPTHPIPVVFNLSSWANQRLPLNRWICQELNQRYQVTKDLATRWIEQKTLLPMLDGLDEVAAPHREECVKAINRFRHAYAPPGLVVCSRVTDYEEFETRLQLQGSVCIQQLTLQQVDEHLEQAGEQLASVRAVLREDMVLRDMINTPLMMRIITLAYAGLPVEDIRSFGTLEERRQHLFNTYIDRMFERRGAKHPFTKKQTIRWLSWLARGMQRHAQSVFYLEDMQPSWLSRKWLTWLFHSIVGISLGLIFWISLNSPVSATSASLPPLQFLGMAIGVILLIEGITAGVDILRYRRDQQAMRETLRTRIGELLQRMLYHLALIVAVYTVRVHKRIS